MRNALLHRLESTNLELEELDLAVIRLARQQLLLLAWLQPLLGGLAPKDRLEPPSEELSYFSAVCCCDLMCCMKKCHMSHKARKMKNPRK